MNAAANDPIRLASGLEVDGYVVIENALSTDQLKTLNAAVDVYLDTYPEEWIRMNDYTIEIENVLPKTEDFDGVIEDPQMLEILRHVIGENITFEQFSFMIRHPSP
jgi:hypothetical protein